MAGPMANFTPSNRRPTAHAITCAVLWRMISRPRGESIVMIASVASCSAAQRSISNSPRQITFGIGVSSSDSLVSLCGLSA